MYRGAITPHLRAFTLNAGNILIYLMASFQLTTTQHSDHIHSLLALHLSTTLNVKCHQKHLTSPFLKMSLHTMRLLSGMDDLVLHRHCKNNDIGSWQSTEKILPRWECIIIIIEQFFSPFTARISQRSLPSCHFFPPYYPNELFKTWQ